MLTASKQPKKTINLGGFGTAYAQQNQITLRNIFWRVWNFYTTPLTVFLKHGQMDLSKA